VVWEYPIDLNDRVLEATQAGPLWLGWPPAGVELAMTIRRWRFEIYVRLSASFYCRVEPSMD